MFKKKILVCKENFHYHKSSTNKETNKSYFNCVKMKSLSCKAKIHFDEEKKIVVKTAGSQWGLGAKINSTNIPTVGVTLEKELRMFLRQVGVPTNVRDWMTAMRADLALAEKPCCCG